MYRKYQINENFFDSIDSEEKAYFLGFLFADGCNNEIRGNIRLSLKHTDVSVLNTLKSFIYPNFDKPLGVSRKDNCNDSIYLDMTNKYMSSTLARLGMIQNKTLKLKFPNIDSTLHSHFIRGYIDGDGCISYFMLRGIHFKCQLRVLGTLEFCGAIQRIINSNCETTGSIRKRGNIHELSYTSRRQVIRVCEYLYFNSNLFLQRKFDKFQQIKNHKDARYK